jgi:hypothetical protein
MKKQLIFLIFLTVLISANEETSIDEKNKNFLIKDKKEEMKDLTFYLANKDSFPKTNEETSSNRYIKASDTDISKFRKVSLIEITRCYFWILSNNKF